MGPLLQALFDTTVTNWELVGLLMLPGIINGIRRGWQEEGFTAIGLAMAVSPLGQRFGEFLILLTNRVIGIFPLGVAILLDRPPEEWPPIGGEIIPMDNTWAQLVTFSLMVLVSYRAGAILGHRKEVNFLGRIAGGMFGAMNVFLILARVFILANPLENDYAVDVPTITVEGLPSTMLASLIYGMIGLIVALFLLLAWFNRKRAQE